jgi:exopolysaccharide biosynthesis polyprenyl glycosylphosphotransferase
MAACLALSAVLVDPNFDVEMILAFLEMRIKVANLILLGGLMTVWHLLFSAFALYEDSLLSSAYRKAINIVKATSIGTCVIVALAAPFEISFVDVRFMPVFWISVSFLSFCSRLVARRLLVSYNRREENRRRILIVGANERAVRIARQFETEKELGCRVIGFVDDTAMHAQNFQKFGYNLVAKYKDLAAYLGRNEMDEVLVCLPVKSRGEDILDVVAVCQEQGIAVGILRDLFKWKLGSSFARQIGEQTIITVNPHAIDGGHAATKRAIDVVVSAVFIVLLAPVFIATGLLIKLTSPGSVIFAQDRVGLNKKRFSMLKFRTMVRNAEHQQAALEQFNEATGPAFKIECDPRVTRIGKFLRKSSIDELPQLINVLKGEMSLVGPRPMAVRDYERFSKDWHRRRFSIRPGITGLWQVASRNHTSFDDSMKLDLEYIDKWSLALDTKLILMTIPAVLRGAGAV